MEPRTFVKYAAAARSLAAGTMAEERLVDFSPLYLALHRAALAVGLDPVRAVAALQAVAVASAAGLLYALLRRAVGRWLALAGVLVFALDRHVLVYRTLLEPDALLLAAVVALLAAAAPEVPGAERSPLARAGLAGAAAALAVGLRPSALAFAALAPLALLVEPRTERGPRALAAALFAAPVAAAALALALAAERATGSPWTPPMNPGTVFFEGNNPLSDGTSAVYPPSVTALLRHSPRVADVAHEHYRAVARAAAGRELPIAEVNRFWRDRALGFLADHPARAARLASAKLARAFHGYRWHDLQVAREFDQRLRTPFLPVSLLAALALAGMLFAAPRWRALLLPYALVAAQLVVMVVFYVSARQRLPLVPAWILFAALALERLRAARPGPRAAGLALVALLAFAFALPDDRVRDARHRTAGEARSDPELAPVRAALARGEPLAAHLDAYLRAIAAAPWREISPAFAPRRPAPLAARLADALAARAPTTPEARFDLAVAEVAAGRLAAADARFAQLAAERFAVYRGATMASLPAVYRARIAARAGDREAARAQLDAALAEAPGDPFALAELAAWGERDAARRLERYFSAVDRDLLVGEALLARGNRAGAAAALARALALVPGLRAARLRLAAALAGLGRDEEAVAHYRLAVAIALEPVLEHEALGALFARFGAAPARTPAERLFAIQALEQLGWFEEAEALLAGWTPAGEVGERAARERARLARIAAARAAAGRGASAPAHPP
jgi:hypothetical protein